MRDAQSTNPFPPPVPRLSPSRQRRPGRRPPPPLGAATPAVAPRPGRTEIDAATIRHTRALAVDSKTAARPAGRRRSRPQLCTSRPKPQRLGSCTPIRPTEREIGTAVGEFLVICNHRRAARGTSGEILGTVGVALVLRSSRPFLVEVVECPGRRIDRAVEFLVGRLHRDVPLFDPE